MFLHRRAVCNNLPPPGLLFPVVFSSSLHSKLFPNLNMFTWRPSRNRGPDRRERGGSIGGGCSPAVDRHGTRPCSHLGSSWDAEVSCSHPLMSTAVSFREGVHVCSTLARMKSLFSCWCGKTHQSPDLPLKVTMNIFSCALCHLFFVGGRRCQ